MRQFSITKTPTPAQEAEAAAALRWLERQPVPAGLYVAEAVPNFRFVLSLASQYQNRGMSLMELVMAGHAAVVAYIMRYGESPEKLADSRAWWMRQGILGAVKNKQQEK